MTMMPKSERGGNRWKRGLIAAILLCGAGIVLMAFSNPAVAWAWMLLLLVYIPILLVCTAVLKYLVLLSQRIVRPKANR